MKKRLLPGLVIVMLLVVLWQTGLFHGILGSEPPFEEPGEGMEPDPANDITLPEALNSYEETPEPTESPGEETVTGDPDEYEITVVAQNLQIPWDIFPLPDGRMMLTERPGNVIIVDEGTILQIDAVAHVGEGGLLGLTPDPAFEENGYVYLYYTYRENGNILNKVERYEFDGSSLQNPFTVIADIPGASTHNGGRIRFGPDGYLYITTGDAQDTMLAQDEDSLAGKILRIASNGEIPQDNPFPGSPIYSLGHRNPQGLSWHPETGALYSSEHGPTRMDEVNHILPGANYGWPLVTGAPGEEIYEDPIVYYPDFTLAPSGMAFFPDEGPWENHLFIAGLRGNMLMRIVLDQAGEVVEQTPMLTDYGRLRNVIYHDGALYVLTNNEDGRGTPTEQSDTILKIEPAAQ